MKTEFQLEANPDELGDESAALAGYQSPSVAAIAALILGLASPLAIFHPLLLVIPFVGAVVALLALSRIAASEGALVGRKAALLGLFLSLASAAGILSHDAVIRRFRVAQASEAARQWIELALAGDMERAYWLKAGVPIPDPNRPEQFGPSGVNPFVQFLDDPNVKAVMAAGPEADIRLESTIAYGEEKKGEYYVRQRYKLTPRPKPEDKQPGPPAPVNVLMQLHRTFTVGGTYNSWRAEPIPEPLPSGQ